jgi:hypothetical protein
MAFTMSAIGMEAWPSIIVLGAVTHMTAFRRVPLANWVPSFKRVKNHIQAYIDLCIGYQDERRIYQMHRDGKLGFFKGVTTYLKHDSRKDEWFILGISILCTPTALMAIINATVIYPLGLMLSRSSSSNNSFGISLGTAFLSGFIIIAFSLALMVTILDNQIDEDIKKTSNGGKAAARERLACYYASNNHFVAFLKIIGFIIIGSWGLVQVLM